MARVLILSQVYPPDRVSSAQIFGDIAEDLVRLGHSVQVVTTFPHFNRDPQGEKKQNLRRVWGPILWKSEYRGIPVYHTFMQPKASQLWKRALGWAGFHAIGMVAGMTVLPRPDVILTVSPPLTIGVAARWLAGLRRTRYIYNVQELYPDLAVDLGIIRNRMLIRVLQWMERYVYEGAAAVTAIGPRIANRIVAKGVPREKVWVIPNPADVEDLRPGPKNNPFSRQHRVVDRFVVSYAGNMGLAQGLDTFVDAAALLTDESDIHFMLMGSGVLENQLAEQVRRLDLPNFTFLPYQPVSTMPNIYAASDLCLVPLVGGIGEHALPSKVYRTMAAARPILAVCDADSELAELIAEAGCGWTVPPADPAALAAAVLEAYGSPHEVARRSAAGRDYVERHNARAVIAARYDELIRSISGA